MGREIKRVPLDFAAPLDVVWEGFIAPPDVTYNDETGEYEPAWEPTDPPEGEGWQVWETASEGSPITPVFPTAEALVEHLSTVGTSWDQKVNPWTGVAPGPWRRAAAEAFVACGWAPSFVAIGGHGPLLSGSRDADLIEGARS